MRRAITVKESEQDESFYTTFILQYDAKQLTRTAKCQ